MLNVLVGVFIVLHGLVHALYLGQSGRFFQLQPELAWPDDSWAFSRLLGVNVTRLLGSVSCALAAIGFVAGGVGILTEQGWWRPVVVGSAVFSTVIFIVFWNGKRRKLDAQGGIGVLINIAILVATLIVGWPAFSF